MIMFMPFQMSNMKILKSQLKPFLAFRSDAAKRKRLFRDMEIQINDQSLMCCAIKVGSRSILVVQQFISLHQNNP